MNKEKQTDLSGWSVEGGVREFARSPVSPFGPLKARRRMDKDEDAR